jgi:homoserine dehydrogenase
VKDQFQFWYNLVLGLLGTGTVGTVVALIMQRKRFAADAIKVSAETKKVEADTDKTEADTDKVSADKGLTEASAAESIQRAASGLMNSFQSRLNDQQDEIKTLRTELREMRKDNLHKDAQINLLSKDLERARQLSAFQEAWMLTSYAWMRDAYGEITKLGGHIKSVPALDAKLLGDDASP